MLNLMEPCYQAKNVLNASITMTNLVSKNISFN